MAIAKAAMCSVQEDLIDFNSSRHCRGAEDDGFTRNLSEDYHVGEGESDGTLGSIGLLNGSLPEEQDDDQFTEERLVETIFSNCESSKSGLLSTERLIAFIKGKVHEKEYVRLSPFVEDLQHMIDPLNLNLDVDKKTFRCVMRDWIVKLQNGNEIYNSLPNHSVSEPVLRTMLPLSASSPLPKKSFVSGNQSSLGLLDISSMSTYSCGSFEGCGGGSLNIDSVDLMDQVTELKFRNKRLEDELTELRTLLNHTEELHANVLTECEMLKKKLYSTQLTAEKSRQLEKESEDLKDSLTTCEGTCHTLRAKIQQLEKENMGLSNKIGELNDEVNQSNSNLEAMKKKERELIDSLTIHKAEIEYWKEQTNIHIVAYNHKERKLNDVKLLVDELSNSLEQAKKEKLDLEIQLSATQDELLSIRSQCSLLQVSKDSMNFPTEMNGTSDTNEEDRSDNESFCFSSPFIKNCGSQRSIQAEIQALGVLDESAPSPFCGKKNSREGASRALFNTDVSAFLEQVVHEKADLRQKHIRKLHSLATLQKNEANREGETPHNEHKTCEIQLTEKELTFVINLLEGVEDGDERLRDLLKKTTSFNIQDMEDNLKSESEASLDGAKDLPSEHAKVKELEQEVEEQRLKIEDLQTQLENNEKEYETSKQANMTLGGLLRNTTNCISFFTRQLSATVAVAEKCGLGEEKMTHLGADFAVKSSTGQVITGQEESENLTKGAEDGWSQIQIDLNGSDGSCAGSQKEGSVYMSPDRLKFQVNRELNALKNQIAKSQAVLAALARSSDLLAGSKGSTEQAQGAGDTVDEVESRESESPRVGHRECARDNQQQSLESVPVGVLNSSKSGREHQLTKSCPAIVSHISTGTQTDVNELLRQKAGSADDVKNDEEPSPQRFRSSSFIAAIEKSKPEKQRIQDCIEEEEEFKEAEEQPIRMFEPRLDGLDLDDYRSVRKLSVLPEENEEYESGGGNAHFYRNPSGSFKRYSHVVPSLELPKEREPPPYRPPPNPYQSRSFESYLDPENSSHHLGVVSIVRQSSDPTPSPSPYLQPPPYRDPPPPGSRFVTGAEVHPRPSQGRNESTQTSQAEIQGSPKQQHASRSTSRPLELPSSRSPSHSPPREQTTLSPSEQPACTSKVVHFDSPVSSPKSPPYQTPPDTSPWSSPRNSAASPPGDITEDLPSVARWFPPFRASRRRRSADTTDKPSADQQRTNLAADADRTQDQAQDDSNDEAFASPTASSPDRGDWSGGQRVHPRLRQRSIPGSPVAAIQRSAAIDYDEAEDDSNSASETVSGNTKKAELEKTEGNGLQKDVEDPPLPDKNQKAFPSLPDSFLKKLGLHRDSKPCDALSEQDIETKFTSLSLAFKTDKITLENRLELQQRQRDLSEKNMDAEINQLKSALNDLNHLCINVETSELLNKIQRQVDVLQQSTERVSSSAEMFGAVQQENRVSRAIEIMLLHVENLKRLYEKEHQELEDARRFLAENNLIQEENVDHGDEAQLRTSRYRSLQSLVGATKLSASGSKRRFSIGALPRSPAGPEGYRTGFNSGFGEGKSKVVGMMRVGSYNHLSRRPSLAPTMKLALCQSDVYSSSSDSVEKPEFTGKSDLCSGMDNIKEIAENVKEGSDKGSDNGSDAVEENNNCKMENICNHKNNYEEYESNFRFESESSDFENEDNLENEDEILLREKCDAENYASLLQKQRTFRDQVLHYSVKARTVVANLSWPWGFEQTLLHIRYCITGLLLFAALLSLVSTFVPTSAEERQTQPISWTDLNELFGPHLSLRHVGPQPY